MKLTLLLVLPSCVTWSWHYCWYSHLVWPETNCIVGTPILCDLKLTLYCWYSYLVWPKTNTVGIPILCDLKLTLYCWYSRFVWPGANATVCTPILCDLELKLYSLHSHLGWPGSNVLPSCVMRNILLFLVQVFDVCGLLQMFSSPFMALFCVTQLAKCSTNTPSVVQFCFCFCLTSSWLY